MTDPQYDFVFYAWTQTQAHAPRSKDFAALDLEHLAEEIAKRATGGLRHHSERYLDDAYQQARGNPLLAIDQPPATFPDVCPWTLAQIMDEDFWLGERR